MEINKEANRIIVVTGAESTGKTKLSKALADKFNYLWEPELSRSYIESLNRPYTYVDVEQIARKQIQQFELAIRKKQNVIFDTGLLITKVWFDVVYKQCPEWLIDAINSLPKFIHLLCDTDLPWQFDPVRENGGVMRQKLHETYVTEMQTFGFPYKIVSGFNEQRLNMAVDQLNTYFSEQANF